MLSEVAKKWVLAELNQVDALDGANIASTGDDLPTEAGFYVQVLSDNRAESFGSSVEVRIRVYLEGEQAAFTGMNAVSDALLHNPGRPKTWNVDPRSKHLSLKSLIQISAPPPAPDGVGGTMYEGILVYKLDGSDLTLAA